MVVGFGIKIFWPGLFITSPDHLARLTETCSLGLLFASLILYIHVIIDTCQNELSADQYHVTISRAQEHSLSRPRVFCKLTADQVLVFYWIAGSCQVNLLKTRQDCSQAC